MSRAPGVGSVAFLKLLERLGSPDAAFGQSTAGLRGLGLADAAIAALQQPDWTQVDADLDWLANNDCRVLTLHDDLYPALLKQIHDPPPLLYVRGDPALLSLPQLAVVGSRNPSPPGERTAADFAAALSRTGLGITSGMALGIDAASHRGALSCGGVTIAVVGTGLDRVYPARHRQLAHDIARQGALVSELPPGTPVLPSHFPRRNRIISGLSLGVLVVEAAAQSGSLITARQALEQGREVYAIPGSIHNPLAKGCNALIRQGAKLVETVADILEELGGFVAPDLAAPAQDGETLQPAEDHLGLLKFVAYEPTSVDTLVALSGETPEAVASTLLMLELSGHIASAAGGSYYRL
ncbi:DNA-processing protein DprA [Methylogaea oryzae]|uniref:DNA-processing protein DprA n=1 Tax=Methylogaea oryzae TaxID=1295382 RepID=UPI003CCEF45E